MGTFVLVVLGIAFVAYWARWSDRRCREHLDAWAAANGYRLVDVRQRFYSFRFLWRRSDSQQVYEFDAVDLATREHRSGAARVGGWVTGPLTYDVAVEWDD